MRGRQQRSMGTVTQWTVMLGVLLVVGWGLSLTLPAKADSGCGAVPADVLQRAQIALGKMSTIARALQLYANDYDDRYPADLTVLYPDYIDDPSLFWHPGDSDPEPTTIDNSVPNAPNSTQISFEFEYTPGIFDPHLVLRDWSAANNDGYFILEYNLECGGDTIPPGCLPVPFPILIAQSRLRNIAIATIVYSNDYNDRLPDDPYALWTEGLIACPRLFWHPGDSDPQPTQITTGALNVPDSVQVSFELLLTGQLNQYSADTLMWQDNTPDNNGGAGRNAAFVDGHIEFIPIYAYNDFNGDETIGPADFEALAGCLQGPYRFITDDFCRHFDKDRDHDVDMAAAADFMLAFGTTAPP